MKENINENKESSSIEEQSQIDSNISEKSQEQLSTEKSNNISNSGSKKKYPGIIIMILITIIYVIMCILRFKQAISSDAMFSGFAAVGVVFYGPIGLAIIWGIYGLWLFLFKNFSTKKYAGIKSFVIVVLIIGIFFAIKSWGPLLYYSVKYRIEEAKISQKGKISSIERETVCIKENNSYVTYVVADNKYGFTLNSLLVRKNALNKKLRYYDVYDNSLIDEYLTSDEWLSRFDNAFLNRINNTQLYQSYSFTNYKISRKFFIISANEYSGFHSDYEWHKMALSGGMTDDWSYFDTEGQIYDDNGNIVDYWVVRVDDQNYALNKCNSKDCLSITDDDNSDYYFRPAFTISNNTKIIKNTNNEYDCKWFIDMDNN